MKHNGNPHASRSSVRETVIVVVMIALVFGVFVGLVHVMAGGPAQDGSSPQAAQPTPSAENAASAPAPVGTQNPAGSDAAAAQDSSPSSG